jgi:hypothetical protein
LNLKKYAKKPINQHSKHNNSKNKINLGFLTLERSIFKNITMKKLISIIIVVTGLYISTSSSAQDYFLKKYQPYDPDIPSPEQFLGYPIGSHHTRHDRIVAYFEKLADISDKATINQYGQTFERRTLIILTISNTENIENLDNLQEKHIQFCNPDNQNKDFENLPVFVNLGYGVHGNEPSSAEAAMLTAYTLVASENPAIINYLDKAVLFVDPTINPDGRDRHTHWANMYKGDPLVADALDVEHNEGWPRGRTNHYWFDLNRDWYLAINPESRGKLKWFHQWYPNVVADFHEMGSGSTYFFEPGKVNGSKDPVIPKPNYTILNDTFAKYFKAGMDSIGSLYFTKEVFDDTYPGYGGAYPDLQGGLGLLFEQASSRGHVQETNRGKLTFSFTIRNQYISSMATIHAAVENRSLLYNYQIDFFKSAVSDASKSGKKAYIFGDEYDRRRTLAFIDKLLIHKIKVYHLNETVSIDDRQFRSEYGFIIPTEQPQYRMIRSMFETNTEYRDSVFYDASAWSLANFYNMPYESLSGNYKMGDEVTDIGALLPKHNFTRSDYVYLVSWDDYQSPAFLYYLQNGGAIVSSAFKPFTISTKTESSKSFGTGTLIIPVKRQNISEDSLNTLVETGMEKYGIEIQSATTGYSSAGIDLGSGNIVTLKKPELLMLIGEGVSSYEAGEVWHLLDTRFDMPITKVQLRQFDRIEFHKYNVMVMVSGNYWQLDSIKLEKIKSWVSRGNTLITIRGASEWIIKQKLVKELLVEEKKDSLVERLPYITAKENIGKERIGGIILKVDLDLTNPLCFGYHHRGLPVYRNSTVWIAPSKNAYVTAAKYPENPLIDGFITEKNLNTYLRPSASLIVSKVGRGRVVLFADNPNFRGSFYGTNRLFLNAIFLGQHIRIPD